MLSQRRAPAPGRGLGTGREQGTAAEQLLLAMGRAVGEGLKTYYKAKIEELEILARDRQHNLRRLEAQRNELNTKGAAVALQALPIRVTSETAVYRTAHRSQK